MNIFKHAFAAVALWIFMSAPTYAQKHDDKDVSITIRVNGEDRDLEEYFEDWSEEFSEKMERLFDKDFHVNIDVDDDDLHIAIDDIAGKTEELGKAIGEAVKEAVTHMNIEIENLSREDLLHRDYQFDDDEISDVIKDIEDRYGSKVKKIERLTVNVREDYVKVKMNVLLENGKRIEKVRIMNND